MPAKIYALLVGINTYQGPVPALGGCVNDVKRMKEFLEERTRGGDYELDAMLLTSGDPDDPQEVKPTRQALIEAFSTHLTRAGEGDIALFHFSGHGAQEKAPPQFWHLEPDHLNETLVCYDSRTANNWDLADKEMAVLIARVAKKNPHIVVILDACHSGSGTRAADGTTARLAETDWRDRPLESYLDGVVPGAQATGAGTAGAAPAGDWFNVPDARHVVLSACRSEELAREKRMRTGEKRGLLSYYLLSTLQQVGPTLSYRDLASRLRTMVRNVVSDQNPVLAATTSEDLERPFLGGAIVEQHPYFPVSLRVDEWVMEGGAFHGIAEPDGEETTHVALFPLDHQLAVGGDLSQRSGGAAVRTVGGSESVLALDEGIVLDPSQSYKAVVTSTPLPRITVHLEGDDRPPLDALAAELQQSHIARVVDDPSLADIRVLAATGDAHYRLKRAGDLEPLSVTVPGKGSAEAVPVAAARVEHMAQWMQLLKLRNSQSKLPADAVTLQLFRFDPGTGERTPLDRAEEILFRYDPKEQPNGLALQLRLHHTSRHPGRLYCMLVDLADDFSVNTDASLFGGGIWLEPGQEVWATRKGKPYFYAYIPRALRNKHISQVRDVLKLIVSTTGSDASLLRQHGLDVVKESETTRGLGDPGTALPPGTLNRLMRRVADRTRALGGEEEETVLTDWTTMQLLMTTEVVGNEQPVPAKREEAVLLAEGLRLQGHPTLRAAALVPFEEGKRDVGNLALPAVFRTHPDLAQPFAFRQARGGDAGDSVILLRDVGNRDAVTPDEPLVLYADAMLATNEAVLPVAFDPESELFLPLGVGVQQGNEVAIRVDRLPAPTADSRDLQGSIKLFFHKVVADKGIAGRLGIDAQTARLAVAMVEEGEVVYDNDPVAVKEKVTAAETILLYVHGFTGDTRGMVSSAYGLKEGVEPALPRLADHYDLLLAWDYESINTPIAESALKLKQALAEVGLGPDHGKRVHSIAHSMGCVVTRWFVEREGGNRVVERVALVAPPNAGTPLAKLQDYALLGLGAALNGLAALVWPPAAIPTLVGMLGSATGMVEKVDVTADELKPGSPFYTLLNASADPEVPYVVVVGNTSKIQYTDPSRAEEERALFRRLAERLTSGETRRALVDLAFFNQPNDMVISVESMLSLPANRSHAPDVVEVACAHNSYFNTAVGLQAVVEKVLAR